MKRPLLAVLLILATVIGVEGAVIWSENFDGYTKDWVCNLADCSVNPGLPTGGGYYGFSANMLNGAYGNANSQITTNAERSDPGGSNKRGYRMYLEEDVWPTGENRLKRALASSYTLLYIRWYQRDSTTSYSNFQKLFRLWEGAEDYQRIILEWQVNEGHVRMNCWDGETSSNHFFTGFNLDTDYTVNTWNCYEVKLDFVNKQAEFWVNGVSKGTLNATWWGNGWSIKNLHIGGNQYGHSWSAPIEHTIDYDDIVFSTTYVGPAEDPPVTYSIGGGLSGLGAGKNVTLRNTIDGSSTDDKQLTVNDAYQFTTELETGQNYAVTVQSQPTGQTCQVANASGEVAEADITNVNVTCSDNPTTSNKMGGGRVSGGNVR